MLPTAVVLLGAALGVSGHYTFPKVNGGADWAQVRRADNWQNNGFVGDVNSAQIRCFQSSPAAASASLNVTAGSSVTYSAAPNVYHPGPMAFYLARVPDGQSINSWNGDGAVWFKVYHEQPNFGSQLTWSSNGAIFSPRLRPSTSLATNILNHRQELVLGSHPQVHQVRLLSSPGRAHRPARRWKLRGCPVLHFVRPNWRNRRRQHRPPEQGCFPRRLQGVRPWHSHQHQLPCPDIVQEPRPGGLQLLNYEKGAWRASSDT
jgi:hypothetical protein